MDEKKEDFIETLEREEQDWNEDFIETFEPEEQGWNEEYM